MYIEKYYFEDFSYPNKKTFLCHCLDTTKHTFDFLCKVTQYVNKLF